MPGIEIQVMPEEDDIQVLYEARNRESLISRLCAVQSLCMGGKGKTVVIVPASAALVLMESPERFKSGVTRLSIGD